MNEGDLVAGRYRLLRPIGAGAMGTVWAARHELLGRDFALKLASISPRAGPEARARFLREAQIVGKLRHPNVVDVADVGDVSPGAGLYLAMELLEGKSLAERITEHGPFPPPEALAIASEVCRGLTAAHLAGVVHRDIKPENIFLARGPAGGMVPKLLDFGISKSGEIGEALITHSGQLFGTPAYMSPEQALGELSVDHRTDVWSLGVVLYEMLTGRRPFAAESYPALLPLIAEKDFTPLPATIPADVQAIISRCLAKARADRFPSADALREALDEARGSPNLASERPGKVERPRALPSLRPPGFVAEPAASPASSSRAASRHQALRFASPRLLIASGIAFAAVLGALGWRAHLGARASGAPPAPTLVESVVSPSPPPPAPSPLPPASASTPPVDASASTAPVAPPSAEPTLSPVRQAPSAVATGIGRVRPSASGKAVTKVNSAGF